jgi:hypothetical protein
VPVRQGQVSAIIPFLPLRLFHLSLRRLLLKVTSFISRPQPFSLSHAIKPKSRSTGYEMLFSSLFTFSYLKKTYHNAFGNGVNMLGRCAETQKADNSNANCKIFGQTLSGFSALCVSFGGMKSSKLHSFIIFDRKCPRHDRYQTSNSCFCTVCPAITYST